MFMTIEDETAVANSVVWQKVFEQFRRPVMGAGLIRINGIVQREGEVIHIVAHHLTDLSVDPASGGSREIGFQLPHGRGDEFYRGSPAPDPRDLPRAKNMPDPYKHRDEICVKARDFR